MRRLLANFFIICTSILISGYCLPQLAHGSTIIPNKSTLSWFRKREVPNGTFEAVTYKKIDVTGSHAWRAPGHNDKRGPCPALNALANHGYLPRNGIVNMLTTPGILNEVYGMGAELGLVLSLYATLLSGDILTLTWSIGDSQPSFLSPLLGGGKGLSGSHNKYETDASVTHGDYYLFDGDVNSVQIPKFKKLLSHQENESNPNYSLDIMIQHRKFTLQNSISTNPQFFYGPFSGLLVSNAGHCFVPGMFSNFTKDHPQGNLSKKILMSMFAVYEDPVTGVFTHNKGWERIPDNWYRRPSGGLIGDYGTVAFAADFIKMALKVPQLLKIGGNTGKVNSFVGVDLGDLTGGIYNALDLLDPAKLVCFIFRLLLVAIPDLLQGGLLGGLIKTALNLLTKTLLPLFDPKCPGIQQWDSDLLKDFPGAGAKAL